MRQRVLWIGGAQWCGKSSIAQSLVERYGLQLYDYDFQDARGHSLRARGDPARFPNLYRGLARTPDESWVMRSPQEMAASTLAQFAERFQLTLEDLWALPAAPPIVAEGWGLRPGLVAPHLESARQAIFLVPSAEFLTRQLTSLSRASGVPVPTSDSQRAQRNRLERNRLLADDVVDSARALGLRTVIVDGRLAIHEVLALVEEHLAPYLPAPAGR